MKKYYLISSFLLASTCIVSPSALEAMKLLLDQDKDIARVGSVGRSKFIEDKAKQRADAARLSDKGDLQTNTGATLRRRFYTTGDGDCFFWATDLTRQDAIHLLLQNAGNIIIRTLAQEEIYDALMDDVVGERNLRRQLRRVQEVLGHDSPIKGEIKTESLENAKNILEYTIEEKGLDKLVRINEVGYRPLPHEMQENLLYKSFKDDLHMLQDCLDEAQDGSQYRQDLIGAKNLLEQRVRNEYCLNENIYREYVQHALSRRDQFMLYPQDVGGNARTYFIDALARLSNRNLVVWAYDDNRTSLVSAHRYNTSPFATTWEVLHEGAHYTRVVPVDNHAALIHGTNRENEYLTAYNESTKKHLQSKLDVNVNVLQYYYSKDLGTTTAFTQNEKQEQQKLSEVFEKQLKPNAKPPSIDLKTKAAYYKALMTFEVDKAVPIQTRIDNIETVLPNLRPQLPALRAELAVLTKKIEFYNNIIKTSKITPTDIEVADVLLQLSLHYGAMGEEAKAKQVGNNLSEVEKKNLIAAEKEATALKVKFGDAFEELQNTINKDLNFQVRLNREVAEKRLADNLAKNLVLDMGQDWNTGGNIISSRYADDYRATKRVVDNHFAALRKVKHLNPAYLSADPFLGIDEEDINVTYPKNISLPEWNRLLLSLAESIFHKLVPATERAYVSNHINTLIPDVNDEGPYLSVQCLSRKTFRNGVEIGEVYAPDTREDTKEEWNNVTKTWKVVETYKYFLHLNGRRIQLVDANQVAGATVSKRALLEAYTTISDVFNRLTIYNVDALADQKKLGRKRIKRIIDKMEAIAAAELDEEINNTPALTPAKINGRVQAVSMLAQHTGRCFDGVSQALDQIEDDLSNKSNFAETEISNIFSSYALKFCEKFADFAGDDEWKTSAPQLAKQRTFFSLPYKGAPRTSFLALNGDVRKERDALFAPAHLMRIFLNGGNVQHNGRTAAFEKFDHNKLTNLVHDAYKRGLQARPVGKVLTTQNIQQLIERDSYLSRIYEEFFDDVFDGEAKPRHSEFFGDKTKNEDLFKKPFFELLLEKLGYIINPARPWNQFSAQQEEESKKRLEKLIADGKAQPKGKLVQHRKQPDPIQDEKTVQNLLTNVYNYHAGNKVDRFVKLSVGEKGQILEIATSLVLKKIYDKPSTTPLIHAWEVVIGKGWTQGKSTQSLLSNVYSYHAGRGTKQLVNLSGKDTAQILETATSFVLKGMYETPDTTPLIHAWEVVMGKGWTQERSTQSLLTNVYNYHEGNGIKQLEDLSAEEKGEIIETATALVLKGVCEKPDTTPLIRAWEMIKKKLW